MTAKNYLLQLKEAESLLSDGQYTTLLSFYETSFLSDLPYLYKSPSPVILHHLLTLALLGPVANDKLVVATVYDGNFRLPHLPINGRAIRLLAQFYQISQPKTDSQIILPQDQAILSASMISTVENLLCPSKSFSSSSSSSSSPIIDRLKLQKIIGHSPLMIAVKNGPWRLIGWPIDCSKYLDSSSQLTTNEQVVRKAAWQTWFPVINWLVNVMHLDLSARIDESSVSNSIIARFLGHLGHRTFVRRALEHVFINHLDNINDIKKTSVIFSDMVYEDELRPGISRAIIEEEEEEEEESCPTTLHDADVVYFQKKIVLLIYQYLDADFRTEMVKEMIGHELLKYFKAFTFLELADFFFLNHSSVSAAAAMVTVPQLSLSNDDLNLFDASGCNGIKSNKSLDTMLLQAAIQMLSTVSSSMKFKNTFPLTYTDVDLTIISHKLLNRDNLFVLLEVEPALVWKSNNTSAEFMSSISEDNDTDEQQHLSLQELDQSIKQHRSLYDRLLKVNLAIYYILQWWISYNTLLTGGGLSEMFRKSVMDDKKEFLALVSRAEEYKIENLKLIIKDNLRHRNPGKTVDVDDKLNQILQYDKLNIISKNVANLLEVL